MRSIFKLAFATVLFASSSRAAVQTLDSLGYRALLNHSVSTSTGTLHGVSGAATITSPNTVHISDFTYNGGGIEVYFYLATADTAAAIPNGVRISPNILGSQANNAFTFPNPTTGQAVGNFDLTIPEGTNLDLYNTISVWCVVAHADFASNTFAPVPEPTTISTLLMAGLPALLGRRRRA